MTSGTKRPDGKRRTQRGQSMVETALILPLLLMLVLGAVDLGRAFYYSAAVRNATRVGAQYAMDPATAQAEIKQSVLDEAAPYLTLSMDRITLATDAWAPGHELTVTASYDFHFLIPLAKAFWGDPIVLSHSTVVRFE
ncbi:MAG: TadE/TadG family type IV pilus assembly protein [Chloroflexota bacterium]